MSAHELAALVVEALNLPDSDPARMDVTAPLFEGGLGLDSLDLLEVALVIQQRYGVKLKAGDPENHAIFSSLERLAQYVSDARTLPS